MSSAACCALSALFLHSVTRESPPLCVDIRHTTLTGQRSAASTGNKDTILSQVGTFHMFEVHTTSERTFIVTRVENKLWHLYTNSTQPVEIYHSQLHDFICMHYSKGVRLL